MRNIFNTYQKKLSPLDSAFIWRNPIHFIACGCGIGAFPFFPGTVATAAASLLVIFLSQFSLTIYTIICAVLFFVGIYLCEKTNRDFGTDDHPSAVFDEIATFPVAMFALPITWKWLLAGFILFRCFDIFKPWPISWVDKHMHNGLGVMLDDLLAAFATLIILHLGYFALHFFR